MHLLAECARWLAPFSVSVSVSRRPSRPVPAAFLELVVAWSAAAASARSRSVACLVSFHVRAQMGAVERKSSELVPGGRAGATTNGLRPTALSRTKLDRPHYTAHYIEPILPVGSRSQSEAPNE